MERSRRILIAAAIVAALASAHAAAREARFFAGHPARSEPRLEAPLPGGGPQDLFIAAAVDTYCTVWYTFESNNWQGWTRVDNTAQKGTFFHVDDFAGLGGGDHGLLHPLEGTKSMWCGARSNASDPYVCSWRTAPGYGNRWSQRLITGYIPFTGILTFSYKIAYDSEPDCDFVYVEQEVGGGQVEILATYTGNGEIAAEHRIYPLMSHTKLHFRFVSDIVGSDEDGQWHSDGGCIVDSIRISDAYGLNRYEDWEGESVGAKQSTDGRWQGTTDVAYGTYSGVRKNLQDKDPCGENFGTQVIFFLGSPNPSTSYPGLYDTPFCAGRGGIEAPCQDEMVVSPVIDLRKYSTACGSTQDGSIPPGDLPYMGRTLLGFSVYEDLPLENLVFYNWYVRTVKDGCAGLWASGFPRYSSRWIADDVFYYWSPDAAYGQKTFDLTPLVDGDSIQVALGIVDMCSYWYPEIGDCAEHTPAPWFDDVRIHRVRAVGPQWVYNDYNLFQDNFPGDELDIESFVRADAAIDINLEGAIRPGDSIAVECYSIAGGGIASDPSGGPAVYLHARCSYIGPGPVVKPPLAGAQLQGSVGAYKSDDGTWTIIQCEPARYAYCPPPENRYAVDLNDSLFTRGYTIEYYFTARDVAGDESALPRWARSRGPYFELTCLPTFNSGILFVDDCSGRGSFEGTAENYWTPTFEAVLPPPNNRVDRYDVNAPESGVSNGPGSRASGAQLVGTYWSIVWDSGDLSNVTISDGTSRSDKSDDCGMLIDWMNLHAHNCGLFVCGDGVASDLDGSSASSAMALMGEWCGVDLAYGSYYELTGGQADGGITNPLVTGSAATNVFVHTGVPDRFNVWGGCPTIKSFDVLEKTGPGNYALEYPAYGGTAYHAGIYATRTNVGGHTVRTMWFGFSYQCIRDNVAHAPIDRFEIFRDVKDALQMGAGGADITQGESPRIDRLEQNFPNPFNPVTTINFDLREKGPVRIEIFDVSGRLVRTLVNGVMVAGGHTVAWDGRNDSGRETESGIYFYRMEAGDFRAVRKLVLLR